MEELFKSKINSIKPFLSDIDSFEISLDYKVVYKEDFNGVSENNIIKGKLVCYTNERKA